MRVEELKNNDMWNVNDEKEIKKEERIIMNRQWELYVARASTAGVRTRDAILPAFEKWMERPHGELSFHTTQFLTGHGCFATFLFRIGKLDTTTCQQCGERDDTMEHTLGECSTWRIERESLVRTLGTGPELRSIIPIIYSY